MRKLKQLTLALLLVTITFAGCKKDESSIRAVLPDAQLSQKTTLQLLAFREQLKLKSSTSLPVDSATWYLEGLLNFENANNDHQFDGLTFFCDTLAMYTAGSSLTLDELNQAYTYFTNHLISIVQSQVDSNFAFNGIDISISGGTLKNGETKIAMVVAGGLNTVGNYIAFGLTDYWVWGLGGGKCGAFAGQGGASDAAKELNYRFTHALAQPAGYITGLNYEGADGTEFPDPANPGPYCDYKIFYFDAGNTGIMPCIGHEELNYYLSKMPDIIQAKKPEGKTYAYANVSGVFTPNYTSVYYHQYWLWYGDFNTYDPNN